MADENASEACTSTRVVTAEAAAECCESGLEQVRKRLIKAGQNVIDAIRSAEASGDFESSFAATVAVLEEFDAGGYDVPDGVPTELTYQAVGFMQNPGYRVDLASGKVTINEFTSGSPYSPGVRAARGGGIAAGIVLATALLERVQRSRRVGKDSKRQTACCGCILEKLFRQDKTLSAKAPRAPRRRVPID